MKTLLAAVILIVLLIKVSKTDPPPKKTYHIFDRTEWADSVLATMTTEEKIGQLFMVAAFSSKEKYNLDELRKLVEQYKIGGVIFFRGSPYRQAEMTNDLQMRSKIPLLIGIDAEWGLAMRLDSTINFGYQMPLGAITDDSVVYKLGHEIALECKRLGVQVNFAPVVDINNNPLNPVIHMRSFGENKEVVTRKALMYMRGMQDEHILAVAKHFPGHGNVSVDSHLDLPVINQPKSELDTLELYPFKKLFAQGVGGVMTAHLHIPAYDSTSNVGASLSPAVTTDLLRRKMKFRGLAFSDALNMKGVSKFYAPGDVDLKALLAGNDVLLYSEDVPRAIKRIKDAVDSGCIDIEFINDRVRRILQVKEWTGLNNCTYVPLPNVTADINRPYSLLLKQRLAEKSITLVKNDSGLIPIRRMQNYRVASVGLGTRTLMPFQQSLGSYCKADFFDLPMLAADSDWSKLDDTLGHYNLVVVSLHNLSNKYTGTYGLSQRAVDFVNRLNTKNKVVLVSFGSPYALNRFPKFKEVICAYQDDIAYQNAAAALLFGALQTRAHLPVTASAEYSQGTGRTALHISRLKYTLPEEAGMSSKKLEKVDAIVKNAIEKGAMPGCQILVAKDGMVVYNRSFGEQRYGDKHLVSNTDLYDLASVTKVAATTLAAMKLYETGKLNIFDPLSKYLPELSGTNKADLQIKEIMSHQAGLQSWFAFYKSTLTADGRPDSMYCSEQNGLFSIRVADAMYLDKFYKDTIYNRIDKSPLHDRGTYHYSDLGFIYMQRVIERITGMPLDKYVDSVFYRPLGLATITYRPREKFELDRIVPTENDTYFRFQLIHGDVHDPAAAMLGGVAGHAGLFSDANDLGIILQMLLDNGVYAGTRFFNASTVHLFTSRQYEDNRRALGWDRPEPDPKLGSPASKYASPRSFGHTGFTGTCIWVDPEYNLIYVFLSNRVYPSEDNNKLVKMNVRTDIHDAIYESFMKP